MRGSMAARTAVAAVAVALAGCELFGGTTPQLCQHDTAPFLEATSVLLPADFEQARLASGDVDGDGNPDLLLTAPGGRLMVWSLRNDVPAVVVPPSVPDPTRTLALTGGLLLDVDGDGRDELLVASSTTSQLLVLDARDALAGTGGLTIRQRLATPANPVHLLAADLDGDGKEEVLVAGSDRQVAAYGASGGSLALRSQRAVTGPVDGVAAEDLDGDGFPELVVSSFDTALGHGVARTYAPFFGLAPDRTLTWNGFDTTSSVSHDAAGLRFAVLAAGFGHPPAQSLVAVDQGSLRWWGAGSGPGFPAQGMGFAARGVTTLDVDGDLRQDLFAWTDAEALDAGGHALLGAVAYGEAAGAYSAPRPIEVSFSPRDVLPVLRHQPWSQDLAAVGVSQDGGLGLHLLQDLCMRYSDLGVASVGPAVQVVQALDGSVPLFAGKPTAVPVTVTSRHPLRRASVRAQLVDGQGAVLAELPLGRPRPSRLKPGLEGQVTFQAVVPRELVTEGTMRVKATVVPPTPAADGDPGDDAASTSFEVQRSHPATFAVVSWRYTSCAQDQATPGDFFVCRAGAPLSTLPAPSPDAVSQAVESIRQVLPSGAVTFVTLELVDPDLVAPRGNFDLARMATAAGRARTRLNGEHPELASAPVFLLTDGPGMALGIPSLTAFGNAATAAHETGHLAGTRHVLCGNTTPDGVDPSYPYPGGVIDGPDPAAPTFLAVDVRPMTGGHWAQAQRPGTCDLMSYGTPRWPSDWTYRQLQVGLAGW